MNDEQETILAINVYEFACGNAGDCSKHEDKLATTMALLVHALELATPHLSPKSRASLFCDIDAMLQAEREACAIAALNAPIKTANQPIREACANAIRARSYK